MHELVFLLKLVFLLSFIIFTIGVLVGVRYQEINLQGRERRLADERRHVNARKHSAGVG